MSINKQYIIFDLDGTITDSKFGILKSMQYAAKHFGVEIKDEEFESYSFFLGPPLRDGFRKIGKFNEEELELIVAKYREYYVPTGMFENELYPGIEDLLKKLKANKKTVILATSKVESYAKKILEHFDILKYFDFVGGCELDGSRADKSEVILYCLAHFGCFSDADKSKAIMVGDRNHDIIGARKAGIESVGVLYGYGSEEELMSGEYRADYIISDVRELTGLLI